MSKMGVPKMLAKKWLKVDNYKSWFVEKKNQIDNAEDISIYSETSNSVISSASRKLKNKQSQKFEATLLKRHKESSFSFRKGSNTKRISRMSKLTKWEFDRESDDDSYSVIESDNCHDSSVSKSVGSVSRSPERHAINNALDQTLKLCEQEKQSVIKLNNLGPSKFWKKNTKDSQGSPASSTATSKASAKKVDFQDAFNQISDSKFESKNTVNAVKRKKIVRLSKPDIGIIGWKSSKFGIKSLSPVSSRQLTDGVNKVMKSSKDAKIVINSNKSTNLNLPVFEKRRNTYAQIDIQTSKNSIVSQARRSISKPFSKAKKRVILRDLNRSSVDMPNFSINVGGILKTKFISKSEYIYISHNLINIDWVLYILNFSIKLILTVIDIENVNRNSNMTAIPSISRKSMIGRLNNNIAQNSDTIGDLRTALTKRSRAKHCGSLYNECGVSNLPSIRASNLTLDSIIL